MRYGSVCSGIAPQTDDWAAMGLECSWFAEIEPFPSAVLAYRHPGIPNYGDFTRIGIASAGILPDGRLETKRQSRERVFIGKSGQRGKIGEPSSHSNGRNENPAACGRGAIDLLVGGTPCQSFSVAGQRGGLDDPRGNLAIEFLRLLDRLRPRWVVWENVPGVLSSDQGRDFGTFLGLLGQLGYGWAYRVLDAQYFGVAQRRRRVFVVGCLGDWRGAAAVLFDRESLSGHPAPRREKGEGVTWPVSPCVAASGWGFERAGDSRGNDAVVAIEYVPEIVGALSDGAHMGGGLNGQDAYSGRIIAHSLRGDSFDAGKDGTGRGTPLVVAAHETGQGFWQQGEVAGCLRAEGENRPSRPSNIVAFSANDHGADALEDCSPTLRSCGEYGVNGGPAPAIAFAENQRGEIRTSDVSPQLSCAGGKPGSGYPAVAFGFNADQCDKTGGIGWKPEQSPTVRGAGGNNMPAFNHGMAVRRLTPRECERLMGMPDDYTLIPFRGKPASDGPRYKAIGNSWAVPVLNWIARRLLEVDAVMTQRQRM